MSITRRQFLLSVPGAVAGFILPSYLARAAEHLEKTGRPLLISPTGADTKLFAVQHNHGSPYVLSLHEPDLGPPEGVTWGEFADEYVGIGWDCYVEDKADYHGWYLPGKEEEFGGDLEALEQYYPGGPVPSSDDLADKQLVREAWPAISPSANAYRFLEELDLGPELANAPSAAGEIHFIDGQYPGDDLLQVEVPDRISLSLLQERLNLLDTDIRIVLWEGLA